MSTRNTGAQDPSALQGQCNRNCVEHKTTAKKAISPKVLDMQFPTQQLMIARYKKGPKSKGAWWFVNVRVLDMNSKLCKLRHQQTQSSEERKHPGWLKLGCMWFCERLQCQTAWEKELDSQTQQLWNMETYGSLYGASKECCLEVFVGLKKQEHDCYQEATRSLTPYFVKSHLISHWL